MRAYIHDSLVIFRRSMTITLQNPLWILITLMQPVLYLSLFGPLLVRVASVPGFPGGDAWQVFVPGLLVQLGIFGASFVGFSIIAELRAGVIDRMMVAPVSRTALITGRVLRDMLVLTFQGGILVGAAYLFGLRVPILAVVAGVFIVALLGGTFAYLSYAAGLALKTEDALAPLINSIALPVLLLSGILLPMTLAPAWLETLANLNPIKYVVDGLRAVFRGDWTSTTSIVGLLIALVMLVLAARVGNRVFKGQTK